MEEIDCGQVLFGYNNKEEKLGCYNFDHITINEHTSLTGTPFVIDGFKTEVTYFKEFVLPEYKSLEVTTNPVLSKHESMITKTNFVTKVTIDYGE